MFKCYDQFVVGLDYNLNARTLSENLTNVHRRQRKETPYYDYPLTTEDRTILAAGANWKKSPF